MDTRAARVGKNEAVFREVNERINDVTREDAAEYLCECGNATCTETTTPVKPKSNAGLRAGVDEVRVHAGRQHSSITTCKHQQGYEGLEEGADGNVA